MTGGVNIKIYVRVKLLVPVCACACDTNSQFWQNPRHLGETFNGRNIFLHKPHNTVHLVLRLDKLVRLV